MSNAIWGYSPLSTSWGTHQKDTHLWILHEESHLQNGKDDTEQGHDEVVGVLAHIIAHQVPEDDGRPVQDAACS